MYTTRKKIDGLQDSVTSARTMFRLEQSEDWKDPRFARAHPRLYLKLKELEARKLTGAGTSKPSPARGQP